MNRTFTATFGYRDGDFDDVSSWLAQAYSDEDQRRTAETRWLRLVLDPSPGALETEPTEVEIRCKDGTTKTVLQSASILPASGYAVAAFVDITQRKRDEILIRTLAEQDSLTGLPNRRVFEAQLERFLDEASRIDAGTISVLMLDLDKFKIVNDTLGHPAGDAVLREAGRRLRTCVRRGDIVARLGGDEFGIILVNSGARSDIDAICGKIIDAIRLPYLWEGHDASVEVSIGVACFRGETADANGLIRAADQALYRVKKEGRGTWRYA